MKTTHECNDCNDVDVRLRDITNYCPQCGSNNIIKFKWFSVSDVEQLQKETKEKFKPYHEELMKLTLEQLQERLKSLIPNIHRFGGQSKLQHDIIDDEFNNFMGKCSVCKGRGLVDIDTENERYCDVCDGKGK